MKSLKQMQSEMSMRSITLNNSTSSPAKGGRERQVVAASGASEPPQAIITSSATSTNEVLVKMVETLRDSSSHLSLRELAVQEREKALVERERSSVIRDTKRMHKESSTFAQDSDAESASIAQQLREKEAYWASREARLQGQIESLKSSLFKLQVL